MFEVRYQIEFQNKETFNLFGQDYYGYKSTFWEAHQTSLNELYKKVLNSGFPLKINDYLNKNSLTVYELKEFRDWLIKNQPFSDSLDKIKKRSEIIYTELLEKCKQENTNIFESYFEILGILWYHTNIEINLKFQKFSINDISEIDLMELEKLNKIELIKVFKKSEMKDEFDRKRYKINSR